ncbi:MipA/OmpV family protein [Synoicihabitans lomoniglobus]|uniref:MipA/OmpV family protein n=1 Tax=Synoicihabitans lomoniglobus TaxID=2909285 RepID=A0AAF0I2X5_9BACT|nr:MipA/OmpV family protein [Opitutaceae bacterium LMO-M01]WED65789.1 MipA/OmpV family protein [Opitutaceae bacterium LMO-M01]
MAATLAASLVAQPPQRPENTGWTIATGGGIAVAPAWQGSDDYQVLALPSIRVTYGDTFFASVEGGMGYRLFRQDGWTAGPLLAMDFGRDNDGSSPFALGGSDSDALRGFADIDTTIAAGAFVTYETGAWSTRLDLLQALGGHEGLTGKLSLDYKLPIGGSRAERVPPFLVSTGPRLTWGDGTYQNTFFGVSAADSAGSGLPTYRASAGVSTLGWGANIARPLNQRWYLLGLLSYERLIGDAADSPLITRRGSPNQFFAGLFASYQF